MAIVKINGITTYKPDAGRTGGDLNLLQNLDAYTKEFSSLVQQIDAKRRQLSDLGVEPYVPVKSMTDAGAYGYNGNLDFVLPELRRELEQLTGKESYAVGQVDKEEQKKLAAKQEAENAKTQRLAEFDSNPELTALRQRIEENKVTPEFTDQYITRYEDIVARAAQPFEQKAQTQLADQINFSDPYNLGGGNAMRATKELANDQAANRYATAIAMGKEDFNRDYTRSENAMDALSKLGMARESFRDLGAERGLKEYYDNLMRDRQVSDVMQQRGWGIQDQEKAIQQAQQIAAMYQPQDQQWYEKLATPILTGVGTALGGPLGGMIGGGISGLFGGGSSPTYMQYLQPNNKSGGMGYQDMLRYYGGL